MNAGGARTGGGADGGTDNGADNEADNEADNGMVVAERSTFSLAARLGDLLVERGLVVTAAESCTGGLVAAAVTAVPGSSAWFGTGFVTYANEAKERLLGVDAETLRRDGAVSGTVVAEMAVGARARAGADVAVAVSGVAGPDGGSAAKPVGTVWLGWALPDGTVETARHRFPGDRGEVRARAVAEALRGIIERVERTLPGPS